MEEPPKNNRYSVPLSFLIANAVMCAGLIVLFFVTNADNSDRTTFIMTLIGVIVGVVSFAANLIFYLRGRRD